MQKNKTEFLILLLGWLMMLSPAQGASFDCTKASTKVEHLICGNAELSKLDEGLSVSYGRALKKSSNPSTLKHEQRSWIKARNKCTSAECLKTEYQERIAFLNEQLSAWQMPLGIESSAKPNKKLVFHLEKDTGWTVCHDIVKNLNKVRPSLASFATELVFDPTMTRFSWPKWQELDIKDHLDVVYAIENKLMHIYPEQAMPLDEWKKKYLANMKAGASGDIGDLENVRRVWRPQLRIAHVRFEAGGKMETVLGYTRNRDLGKWKKGWYAACPDNDYSTSEAAHRAFECGENYDKRMGIKSLEGYPGEYLFIYAPENREVHTILSGDKGAGADSMLSVFLFLHNGRGFISSPDIVGMAISRVERIVPARQTVPSWMQGRYLCGIQFPHYRNQ